MGMDTTPTFPIAVIGLSCRFPGEASNPGKLWEILLEGRNCGSEAPKQRYDDCEFHNASPGGG